MENSEWIDIKFIASQVSNEATRKQLEKFINQKRLNELTIQEIIEVVHLAEKNVINSNEALLLNKWFDFKKYESYRNDVKNAPINSTLHFFSTNGSEQYPDLSGKDIHTTELIEKNSCNRLIDRKYFSKDEITQEWRKEETFKSDWLNKSALRSLLSSTSNQKVVISFSHDNPFENAGGIQKIIRYEVQNTNRQIKYISIFPFQSYPFTVGDNKTDKKLNILGIAIDGEFKGYTISSVIYNTFIEAFDASNITCILHHVFGFDTKKLSNFLNILKGKSNIYFWVHDFCTSCISYTLLREDLHQCKSPSLNSIHCEFCIYGDERKRHINSMKLITKISNITFIYPSKSAYENVRKGYSTIPIQSKSIILPHVKLIDPRLKKKIVNTSHQNLKIAFIGSPVHHKGWEEFSLLTKMPKLSNHIDWHHYGKGVVPKTILSKYFDGTKNDGTDLVKTIKEDDIDIAIIWPLWQETFCFVAFEAAYAGCHIMTNEQAGNVTSGKIPNSCRTIFKTLGDMVSYLTLLCDQQPHELEVIESAIFEESGYSCNFLK